MRNKFFCKWRLERPPDSRPCQIVNRVGDCDYVCEVDGRHVCSFGEETLQAVHVADIATGFDGQIFVLEGRPTSVFNNDQIARDSPRMVNSRTNLESIASRMFIAVWLVI